MTSAPAPVHMRLVVNHQPDREDGEEFHHRMKVNCLAAAAIVVLLAAGLWLANAMVDAQKAEGCYVSGNRSCSLI